MVIDENDAFQVFNTLETMPEDLRPRAASLLADYRTQQTSAGLPLWPTQEAARTEKRKRMQSAFDDPLTLDIDDGSYVQADRVQPGLGDTLRKREASILWLADRYGADEMDVRKRLDFYKADAAEKWGAGLLDDSAFFARAKQDLDAETIAADKRKQAALTGWESAISGATMPSELARFQESYPDATEDEKLAFADALFQSSVKVLPYRELVKEASGALSKEMESALPTTDAFQKVADSLLAVPIKDRSLVIKLIGAAGGATPKERAGYLSKLAGAMGRITETIGASVAGSMTEAAFSESATSLREAGNFSFAKDMEVEADKQGQYRILTQMIRQTADQEINPIKGDGWWGQLGIDVARMIPQTAITIANPVVGFGANLTYFQDTQAAQAMMEDPNLTYKQAQSITALSAPVSAAAETLTALIPFGKVKLPFLSKWTHAATTSTGGFLRKYGVRSAAGTATEIVEEYVQAAAPLVSQELLGVLSADMPDVDWESRMPDFSKIAEQTWAPALVFSLVGAGATSMMDVKNGRTLASDLDLMVATGIKPELAEKIKTASDAGNWSQVDGLFREDFTTPTDKKATAEERTQATTRLTERVRAMTAADKVNWDSPDYTVSVTRGASGWRVETGDGQTIPVDSAEAARQIYENLRQVGSQQEADALVGIIDNYHAKDAKAETVLTGEDVLGSNTSVTAIRDGKERPLDSNALETIRKEAENIGIQTGTEDIFAHVNGSNIVFANKVGKDAKEIIKILNLYQSQKGGQPQVVTFLHESIESNFALGLKTGAINEAEVRQAFAALAPALDPARVRKARKGKNGRADQEAHDLERKLYENVRTLAAGGGDATMLRETFSELAVRDAFARDRSNKTAGSVGSISRAIEAAVMGAKTQEEATFLVRFRAMLKAFSTYLKGVLRTVGEIKRGREKGLIGEEWDAFVDKVTGLDETKLLEHQAAVEAVRAVTDAGNMAFSVSPGGLSEDEWNRLSEREQEGILRSDDVAKARSLAFPVIQLEPGQRFERIEIDSNPARSGKSDSLYFNGSLWLSKAEVERLFPLDGDGFFTDPNNLEDEGYVTTDEGGAYKAFEVRVADHPSTSSARTEADVEMMVDDGRASRPNWYQQALSQGSPDAARSYVAAVQKIPAAVLRHFKLKAVKDVQAAGNMAFSVGGYAKGLSFVEPKAGDKINGRTIYAVDKTFNKTQPWIVLEDGSAFFLDARNHHITHGNPDTLPSERPELNHLRRDFRAEAEARPLPSGQILPVPKSGITYDAPRIKGVKAEDLKAGDWIEFAGRNIQIKSTENRGSSVWIEHGEGNGSLVGDTSRFNRIKDPGDESFSVSAITPAQDSEYLAAVEAGDMETAQRMVDEAAKAITPDQARTMLRPSEKEGGVDPRSGKMWVVNGRQYLFERMPLTAIGGNQNGDLYDSTTKRGLAENYARREGDFPPIILTQSKIGDQWEVKDGGHRISAARMRGDGFIDTIRQFSQPDPVTRDESGQVIPLSQRFNPESNDIRFSLAPRSLPKERDTEYLAAVEAGDMAKAQAMVDEAAKAAGYDVGPVYHGTEQKGLTEFYGGWWSDTKKVTREFGSQRYSAYLKGPLADGDTLRELYKKFNGTDSDPDSDGSLADSEIADVAMSGGPFSRYVQDAGYQGIEVWDESNAETGMAYSTFNPNQIKSADPVTYDESGNVIPLSQRFNAETPDIRFSISAITNLEEVQEAIYQRMTQRPEEALRVWSNATRKIQKLIQRNRDGGWTWDGKRIREISDKRTVKSLDKEQAMREATRESELIDEGLATLTPETMLAYSEGVGVLEDDPLIAEMLHDNGKLMSKSTAVAQGKKIEDLYEDAGWIPPSWYARGGGIMPDVMADNLGFQYASEMWAALESSIKSHRSAKEGYTKAEKAVRDVEKAAKEQAKEEAQAWRDEAEAMQAEDWNPREAMIRDLVAYEAILSTMPKEIRGQLSGGFVALARKGSEAGRGKVIKKKVEKMAELLEKHFKDELGKAVVKLLDQHKSQKDSSGRMTGKILADATEQVDFAAEFIKLDIEAQAEKTNHLEKTIEESEDSGLIQDALNRLGIARMFELWSDKDAASRESALQWLTETIAAGKAGKSILDEARAEFLNDMRTTGQGDIMQGDEIDPNEADNLSNLNKKPIQRMIQGIRGMVHEALWTTVQRLELIFGEDSKITDYFGGKVIAAANLSNDIKRDMTAQMQAIQTVIFNTESKLAHARAVAKLQTARNSGVMLRRVKKKKTKLDLATLTKLSDGTMTAETAGLRQDEVDAALEEFAANPRQRTVTVETVVDAGNPIDRFMSELQGVQWWLWWQQDASRKQMEHDGWTEENFAQLEEFLSPEAKALGRWMASSYNQARALIDPIYRRLFNAPLPNIKGYSPIHRMTAGTDADVMDMAASDMSSGLAAGFTKSRVNSTAPLLEMDALAVFMAHWENVSHWVAHAELMRDMKAVLLDKDTATAIRQKKSDRYLLKIKQDIKTIESNGTNSAKELTDLSRFWRFLMQYRAYKGLAFRISPIAKQTSALLNPMLADVPAHNYAAGLGRFFTEPRQFVSDVAAMWKSDVIRRRVEGGFSAEARIARQGSSMTGSQALVVMQAGMMPMAKVDAGWTSIGAAVAFDYYRRSYLKNNVGATAELADAHATARLERMIATSAQPSDIANRSLSERSTNPFMRSLSMFISDQRKALAIELMAIRRLTSGKSKNAALDAQRVLVAHIIQGAVTQSMVAIMALAWGDDDDKDRELSLNQWALALSLGPVNGLFAVGKVIDKFGRLILGLRVFNDDNLLGKAADDLVRGAKSMDELFDPDDAEDVMGAIDSLSTASGAMASSLLGPAGGVVDVAGNLAREAAKITRAMAED